jgi:AcrR family transcriptional regulator
MNQRATDERVIEAAIGLFARQGYNGTSIREITRAADANLGAVTYHFGGKRALYGQALERCIGPLAERVATAARGAGGAIARLEAVMEVYFDYLHERPELPQLMLQETVAGRAPPAGALKLVRSMLAAIAAVIEEGQAAGEIAAGEARLLAVSVVSQPLHLTLATSLLDQADATLPAARGRLLEHARAFIRSGLSPAGAATEPMGES